MGLFSASRLKTSLGLSGAIDKAPTTAWPIDRVAALDRHEIVARRFVHFVARRLI